MFSAYACRVIRLVHSFVSHSCRKNLYSIIKAPCKIDSQLPFLCYNAAPSTVGREKILSSILGTNPMTNIILPTLYTHIIEEFPVASSSQGVDRQDVSTNAISASKQGQEAIRDLLGCLRDLMVPFCHFMDQKNGGLITPHQAFTVTQQYCEIVQQLQANREVLRRSFVTVREQCQGLREPCAEKLIPYTDRSVPLTTEMLTHSESRSIMEAHDQTVNRYLEVSDELERMRRTLTTALWELNDLMDPVVLKQ